MKNNRNPSGKTPQELAELFLETLREGGLTHQNLFDNSLCIAYILPFPECMPDYERPCDKLEELIEMGELDDLLNKSVSSAEDLKDLKGYLVEAEFACLDFSNTNFDMQGYMANGASSGSGSWVVRAFALTLDEAYKGIVNECLKRVTKEITNGLKN